MVLKYRCYHRFPISALHVVVFQNAFVQSEYFVDILSRLLISSAKISLSQNIIVTCRLVKYEPVWTNKDCIQIGTINAVLLDLVQFRTCKMN